MMQAINWVKKYGIVLTLFSLAAVLRLVHLDFQDIWIDEIYSMMNTSSEKSLGTIYEILLKTDPHPPLYYMSLSVMQSLLGHTIWVARFFSAIFGIGGVVALYYLGKTLFSKSTGILAVVFLSVNFAHVYYSQEIRMYSMLFFFTTVSFIALVRYLKSPTRKRLVLFILTSYLMINTHFFALFTFVGQYCILGIFALMHTTQAARFKELGKLVIAGLITLFFYIPALRIFINTTTIANDWIIKPGLDVTSFLIDDLFGRFEFAIWIVVLGSIMYFLSLTRKEEEESTEISNSVVPKFTSQTAAMVLLIWLTVSFLIPYLYTYLEVPILVNRYLLSLLAPLLLLVAHGINQIRSVIVKVILSVAFLTLSLVQLIYVKHYYSQLTKAEFSKLTTEVIANNPAHHKVVTYWGWLMPYFFESASMEVVGSELNAYIDQMRSGQMQVHSFWFIDGNSRPMMLRPENQEYINTYFHTGKTIEKWDAWATHFVLKADAKVDSTLKTTSFEQATILENGEMGLFQNKEYASNLIQLEKGSYELIIQAKSLPEIPILGENAHLYITLNHEKIGDVYVSENPQGTEYRFPFTVVESEKVQFGIGFDNDTFLDGQDRNLLIQSISIQPK